MSDRYFFSVDGCRLAYEDDGDGLPVLWQHGLGADREQPAAVFPSSLGFRRITLECRGHGRSELGGPKRISMAHFTEDAIALLDHLGINRTVVGGISLGAAIALRLAALHPERVSDLILARPAWVDGPSTETMSVYLDVAQFLSAYGAAEGLRRFETSPRFIALEIASPDNAKSLRGLFVRPDPASTIALLSRIPADSLGLNRDALSRIAARTLIVVNAQDAVHPLAYGERLQLLLPNARLRTITSKTVDPNAYVLEFKDALAEFLTERIAS